MILRDILQVLPNGKLKEWDTLDTDTMVIEAYDCGRLSETTYAHNMEIMPFTLDYTAYWDAPEFTKDAVNEAQSIKDLMVLYQNERITNEEIAEEQQRVFDEIFTVHDILIGNTIEMNQEARKIAITNLKERI